MAVQAWQAKGGRVEVKDREVGKPGIVREGSGRIDQEAACVIQSYCVVTLQKIPNFTGIALAADCV